MSEPHLNAKLVKNFYPSQVARTTSRSQRVDGAAESIEKLSLAYGSLLTFSTKNNYRYHHCTCSYSH